MGHLEQFNLHLEKYQLWHYQMLRTKSDINSENSFMTAVVRLLKCSKSQNKFTFQLNIFSSDSSQIGVADTLAFIDFEFTEASTVELQKSISPKKIFLFKTFPHARFTHVLLSLPIQCTKVIK